MFVGMGESLLVALDAKRGSRTLVIDWLSFLSFGS
jgi:hypothetical protein